MTILKQKSPEQYQRLLDLFKERARRKEANKAKHFVPNGRAQQFIELVGSGEAFISMFIAGNGVGKSCAGANIVTNIVYGPQSPWFRSEAFDWTDDKGVKHTRPATPMPLFEKFPYLKRGRIISDPTSIKEKIIPELKKWFPANESKLLPVANYQTGKEGKAYEAKFVTNTGFEIDIMSNEQEVKEFESVDLGFVWVDEPMPKDRFIATVARGRLGMVIFMTFTPLTYSAWLKDFIDEKMLENKEGEIFCDYVEAEVEDNCKLHGVRGILEHAAIKRMVQTYSADEFEARAMGKFGHLIGRVHKAFRRKVHVIRPFPIDERRFTVYTALDPHPRNPDHMMWLAVDRNGTKYICGELVTKGTTPQLAERIMAFESARNFRVESRIIDPSAYNNDQHKDEPSVGARLSDLGLDMVSGSKDLQAGIKRTDDALFYEEVGGEMVRRPELFIFDTCPVTIKQLEEYVWSEYKGNAADEKKPKGQPVDKNDHMPENLHRLLLAEPVFVPKVASQRTYQQSEGDDLDPY
jgi:hypothetical protein